MRASTSSQTGTADLTFAVANTDASIATDFWTSQTEDGTMTYSADVTSGYITMWTDSNFANTGDIVIDSTLTTSVFTDCGPDCAYSGSIYVETQGLGGSITGAGTLRTGDVTLAGTGSTDVTAGGVTLYFVDEIEGITIDQGNATVTGGAAGDFATVNSIDIYGYTGSADNHIGTNLAPVVIHQGDANAGTGGTSYGASGWRPLPPAARPTSTSRSTARCASRTSRPAPAPTPSCSRRPTPPTTLSSPVR